MRRTWNVLILATFAACLTPVVVEAGTILPADTQGEINSYTTPDGEVTLKAYASTNPLVLGNFNTISSFIGVSNLGNVNGINDTDGKPATGGDQEAIDIEFASLSGLASISFQFSRADGPAVDDGIQIKGFVSDPMVTVTAGTFLDVRYDATLQSVFAELSGAQFNNEVRTLSFGNLDASLGQTLRITANDSNEAGSQAAIFNIGYTTIPEPSSVLLVMLGVVPAMLLTRRS